MTIIMIIQCILIGLLSGTLGGLLGIGGAIIIMPFLRFYLDLTPQTAVGTCLLVVFIISITATIKHYRKTHFAITPLLPIIIPGVISTLVFSLMFTITFAKPAIIDLGLGVIFLLIALKMGLNTVRASKNFIITNKTTIFILKILVGLLIGFLTSFLGIGAGSLLVPLLMMLFNFPMHLATSASLACFSLNAFTSTIVKCYQELVLYDYALLITLGALPGAYLGSILNFKTRPKLLELLFAIITFVISIKFLYSWLIS